MASDKHNRVGILYSLRRSRLNAFFRGRAARGDETADLTQEAFLRVLRADASRAIQNPEAYLFTIAGNLAREHAVLRRRSTQNSDVADPNLALELSEWPDYDADLDRPRRHHALLAALDELSPKCRAAVILQYRDGLTYQQIAEQLGVSSNMVKKYLSNALRHCRERLASDREQL